MDLNTALGTVGLGADGGPCRLHRAATGTTNVSLSSLSAVHGMLGAMRALLDEVQGKDQDRINYMLLSLILDLWRRNEYAYIALKEFAQYGDPEWAARINVHSTLIGEIDSVAPIDWPARAELCNAIVHRLLEETEVHHQALLDTRGEPVKATVGGDELARISRHAHAGGGHAAAGVSGLSPFATAAAKEVFIIAKAMKGAGSRPKKRKVQVSLKGEYANGGVMVEGETIVLDGDKKGAKSITLTPETVDVFVSVYANGGSSFDLETTINGSTKKEHEEWFGGAFSKLYQYPFTAFGL